MSGKQSLPLLQQNTDREIPAGKSAIFSFLLEWAPFIILVITGLIYSKAAYNQFLLFDDDNFILKNPLVQDTGLKGIEKIFTTFNSGKYQPFTTLSFALEYRFFGFDPFTFHLTNIILHLLSTFVVFKIAERLSGSRITAIVVALLFGIHPMHVEEVAWASERKDMMYAFFYLSAILVYLIYQESGYRIKYYIAVFLLFIVSLFSKTEAVTLPVVLLIIDVYKGRKVTPKMILEKIPLLAISIFFGILGSMSRQADGLIDQFTTTYYGFINRIFLFTTVPSFYIIKLIAPFRLSAMHYYPDMHGGLLPWPYYASLPFMLFIAWLVIRRSSFRKEILFGAAFFVATICIMPQVVSIGPSLTPERYSYIPYFGFFYIIGQWITIIEFSKWQAPVFVAFSCFVIMFCIQTYLRIGIWKNNKVIFTDVLEKNSDVKDCSFFYWLRGNSDVIDGDINGALEDYTQAIAQNREYAEAYGNRGVTYFKSGNIPAAITDLNRAISINPNNSQYYSNRAPAKASAGDLADALTDYNSALKLDPGNNIAYTDRGMVRLNLKDTTGACGDWKKAASMGNETAPQLIIQYCH